MKDREQKLNLAYITSKIHGLSAFNNRVIDELIKLGMSVLNNKTIIIILLIYGIG